MNLTEATKRACEEPTLVDALSWICVWESERAIDQARHRYDTGANGAGWDTCFKVCIQSVMDAYQDKDKPPTSFKGNDMRDNDGMKEFPSFYCQIEEKVRKIVYHLRNHGINTDCSCEHGMWIQCATVDPTTELRSIYDALHELDITNFRIVLFRDVRDGHPYDCLEIMLPDENGEYYMRPEDNPDCTFNGERKVTGQSTTHG